MPSFPCDNSDDFIPDEMYDSVRNTIEEKTNELGRYLTKEEIEACFLEEGFDPPNNCYEDAYGDDKGEEGYVRIKFEARPNQPDEDKLGNSNQDQASTPQTSFEEVDSILNRAFVRRQIHMEKLLKDKNLKTRSKKKQTNQTDAPIKISHESSKDSEHQSIAATPTQLNSIEELMALHGITRRMAEYFAGAQRIAQEHGITATLAPQKKDHSTPPKTRFIFLSGKTHADSEQKPTDQHQTK